VTDDKDSTAEPEELPEARLVKDKPVPRNKGSEGSTEIELEASRQRLIGWTVFGIIVGLLLILKLGTVGVWVGFVLVALGVYRGWQLAQTFMYPPGTIVVSEKKVSLPRGLCLPRPLEVEPSAVTAAYFLRRSVPWNRSAPVLVVELGTKAMAFPRDWFASEADQRHVIHALMRRSPKIATPATPATPATTEASDSAN
jgi:hypothetical protein